MLHVILLLTLPHHVWHHTFLVWVRWISKTSWRANLLHVWRSAMRELTWWHLRVHHSMLHAVGTSLWHWHTWGHHERLARHLHARVTRRWYWLSILVRYVAAMRRHSLHHGHRTRTVTMWWRAVPSSLIQRRHGSRWTLGRVDESRTSLRIRHVGRVLSELRRHTSWLLWWHGLRVTLTRRRVLINLFIKFTRIL